MNKILIILSRDCNSNFVSKEAQALFEVLENNFNLKLNNGAGESTTRSRTTNDAIFARQLNQFSLGVFIWYFSWNKPVWL